MIAARRFFRRADGEPGLNYLCRGFRQYFAHAIPEVERIVRRFAEAADPAPETDVTLCRMETQS